jgi:hypothetical protein
MTLAAKIAGVPGVDVSSPSALRMTRARGPEPVVSKSSCEIVERSWS